MALKRTIAHPKIWYMLLNFNRLKHFSWNGTVIALFLSKLILISSEEHSNRIDPMKDLLMMSGYDYLVSGMFVCYSLLLWCFSLGLKSSRPF